MLEGEKKKRQLRTEMVNYSTRKCTRETYNTGFVFLAKVIPQEIQFYGLKEEHY